MSTENKKTDSQTQQFLSFTLRGQLYGLPIQRVKEISTFGDVTPVPRVPEFVLGVMNLRGKIIPVIDLRLRFGVDISPFTRDTCIVILEGPQGEVGIVVDSVEEVLTFPEVEMKAPPAMGSEAFMKYVKGIARKNEELVMLVDIGNVLSFQEYQDILKTSPQEVA